MATSTKKSDTILKSCSPMGPSAVVWFYSKEMMDSSCCAAKSSGVKVHTSAEQLQVASLLLHLQLQHLLQQLLPQRLLHESHPLQLLPVQTQQSPTCRGKAESRWRWCPRAERGSGRWNCRGLDLWWRVGRRPPRRPGSCADSVSSTIYRRLAVTTERQVGSGWAASGSCCISHNCHWIGTKAEKWQQEKQVKSLWWVYHCCSTFGDSRFNSESLEPRTSFDMAAANQHQDALGEAAAASEINRALKLVLISEVAVFRWLNCSIFTALISCTWTSSMSRKFVCASKWRFSGCCNILIVNIWTDLYVSKR